jgi:hypothetical protein
MAKSTSDPVIDLRTHARVAIPAFIYVNVPREDGESDEVLIQRAAALVEAADQPDTFLRIVEGFDDSADAIAYPKRDGVGKVSIEGAEVQ